MFNKQFLFSKRECPCLEGWNRNDFKDYFLYTHPELNFSREENESLEVFLVGDILDAENTSLTNQEILGDVLAKNDSPSALLEAFGHYCGGFLVFVDDRSSDEQFVFGDTAVTRELFYYQVGPTEIIAGSQPNIIEKVQSLEKYSSQEARSFYESPIFSSKQVYVGDQTEYMGVRRLKPNKVLNIKTGNFDRFFPRKPLESLALDETVEKAAKSIQGFLEAASKRQQLAIPVTAGWESRVLLAASKRIKEQVYYFVVKHPGYTDDHPDIKIPQKLLQRLGLKLNVLEYPQDVQLTNNEREEILQDFSNPRFRIFNYVRHALANNFTGKLVVNGNVSEVARMQWDEIDFPSAWSVAVAQECSNSEYASKIYKDWFEEASPTFVENGYRVSDMLYWEENCANVVAKTNTEFGWKTEVFQPFNSRHLLTTMMSVDKKYRQKQNPEFYAKMVRLLWEDCLTEPVNPGFKKQVIRWMQKLGVYGVYRNGLFKLQMLLSSQKGKIKQ